MHAQTQAKKEAQRWIQMWAKRFQCKRRCLQERKSEWKSKRESKIMRIDWRGERMQAWASTQRTSWHYSQTRDDHHQLNYSLYLKLLVVEPFQEFAPSCASKTLMPECWKARVVITRKIIAQLNCLVCWIFPNKKEKIACIYTMSTLIMKSDIQ